MTDEQINAAIAKATDCAGHGNYTHDLNAMHEAEKVLDSDELFRGYYLALYDITKSTRCPVHATARQRAEAFLRTLGKWEDGK
jgi:hypothetical protein